MSGAYSRNKGARYERELCPYLSAQLDVEDVITSRDGRGGAQGGADFLSWDNNLNQWVSGVAGWEIEAKWVKSRQAPTWLRKTQENSYHPWFCVFHRTDGTSDRNQDRVYLPRRMLLDVLIYGQKTVETYDVTDYVQLTAGQWCEVAS